MRIRLGFLFGIFLAAAVSAHGATIVFDNFSCPDSVSLTGASGFNDNVITCSGSLGGEREDFLLISGGSSSSVTTMNSNPPTGAVTGTFGSGIDEFAGMVWGSFSNELNLDLVGDSILVRIQSDSGGTLTAGLCSSAGSPFCNGDNYSATFSGSAGYQDVLIPLTGTPTAVLGSGGNLEDVNVVNVYLSLDTPGSTWTIDGVEPVPEPSTLLLLTIGLLLVVMIRSRCVKDFS
ncbi:MAG: PEP-CTERM sorting domain-containing protein [Bryobacteraceae bacterium]